MATQLQQLHNRTAAGRLLASQLMDYANRSDVIVLGIPRGGVPVAAEIAEAIAAPLDICLVRKLGVPRNPELAMGAMGLNGAIVLDAKLVKAWKIPQKAIERTIARERQELARRDLIYRGDRPPPQVSERVAILVDDGIATGATFSVALALLRHQNPKAIAIAVPILPPAAYKHLQTEVDCAVCLMQPEPIYYIGLWYDDFSPTTDAEVCQLLAKARDRQTSHS